MSAFGQLGRTQKGKWRPEDRHFCLSDWKPTYRDAISEQPGNQATLHRFAESMCFIND